LRSLRLCVSTDIAKAFSYAKILRKKTYMQAEIVTIGTELLLGQIVDTNAAFIGQVLAENGINLYQKTTVGDNPECIRSALEGALGRSDVVLTSGGLSPTADDITRECVAQLLGRPLVFRQELYDQLAARFARFRFKMTENNEKQAMAPEGAIAIENPHGTAPGLIVEDDLGTVICMPGVPRELKPMLTDRVIPYLREKFGLRGVLQSRVLKVCGVGESRVDTAIADLIASQQNPTVGVLASPDAVHIRITARAQTLEEADGLIDPVDAAVHERLPGLVIGADDATLEQAVDTLLVDRGWRLAVAETHTGGMVAQRLTAAGVRCFAGGRILPTSAPHRGGLDMSKLIRNVLWFDSLEMSSILGCNLLTGRRTMSEATIRLHIETLAEGGYIATSPDVPGLVAEGRSITEAVEIAQGLARRIVESCMEHGDPLPPALSHLADSASAVDLLIPVSVA